MADMQFKLEGQLLTKLTEAVISSGDVNVNVCHFTFDSEWDGYTKIGTFYQDKNNVQYSVLKSDDSCFVPAEAMMRSGIMYVGVFGVKGAKVLTSTLEQIEILPGAIADGKRINTEPTDDVFLAIIAQYNAILEQLDVNSEQYTETMQKISEQNRILETINAFDVTETMERITQAESVIESNKAKIEKNFRIDDVQITFDSVSEFRLDDERITSDTLIDVYFDEMSAPTAAEKHISVESYNGYILFKTVYECNETLTASLYCMGV